MRKQNKPRTNRIETNNNISFPIGTIVAVQKYSKKLNFSKIFSKFKQKGIDLTNLVEALISYRLTENQSLTKASDWINRKEVLLQFLIKSFEQRTLFRSIETIGENYNEVVLNLLDEIFTQYDFCHTDVNMDWSGVILWGTKATMGKY